MTDDFFIEYVKPYGVFVIFVFWILVFAREVLRANTKARKQALRADLAEQRNGDLVHRIFDLHDSIRSLVADRDRLLAAAESFIRKYGSHLNGCIDNLGETAETCRDNVGREGCPRCRGYDRDEDHPVLYRKATDPLCHKCQEKTAHEAKLKRLTDLYYHKEDLKWNF